MLYEKMYHTRIIITSIHHVCILLQSMYVFAYCMYGIGFRLLRRPSINFGDAELKRDYSGRTNGTGTIHLTTKNPTPHHAQPVSMVCIPARVVLYCDSQYAQYIHIMHTRVRMHTSYERRSLVLASNVKYMHTTSYAYYQLEQYAYYSSTRSVHTMHTTTIYQKYAQKYITLSYINILPTLILEQYE